MSVPGLPGVPRLTSRWRVPGEAGISRPLVGLRALPKGRSTIALPMVIRCGGDAGTPAMAGVAFFVGFFVAVFVGRTLGGEEGEADPEAEADGLLGGPVDKPVDEPVDDADPEPDPVGPLVPPPDA